VDREKRRELYDFQEWKCAICGKQYEFMNMMTDHDHETGFIRGLLCIACNSGLGMFKEDIELFNKAIAYVQGEQPAKKLFGNVKYVGPKPKPSSYYYKNRKARIKVKHLSIQKPPIAPKYSQYKGFEVTCNKPGANKPWRVRHKELRISRYFKTREEAEAARVEYVLYYFNEE